MTRRVHAELTLGHGLAVGYEQVSLLMRRAGIQGTPGVAAGTEAGHRGRPRGSPLRPHRPRPAVDIDNTEHFTREGKVYSAVVLDVYSRRVVGWPIDATQTAALVTNALGMAIDSRTPSEGTLIHSSHGVQFTSRAFTRRALDSGPVTSMGSIGDSFDNAVIESFWSRMRVELLDRKPWKTRIEPANTIFEYLEIFHNRQRRHSALGMLTPIEFEAQHATSPAARESNKPTPLNPEHSEPPPIAVRIKVSPHTHTLPRLLLTTHPSAVPQARAPPQAPSRAQP